MSATGAVAAPEVSVKTVFYDVRGSTPQTLLNYMLQNGPHGENGRALGTTSATISQNMGLQSTASGCRVRNYRLNVAITISLPKLAAGQKLAGSLRSRWHSLVSYVKVHENYHKTMFVACARRIDQRIRKVTGSGTCSEIRTRVRAIFNEENARCDRLQRAFDQQEAPRVRNLPFIRQASGTEPAKREADVRQRRTTRRSTPSPVTEQSLK